MIIIKSLFKPKMLGVTKYDYGPFFSGKKKTSFIHCTIL